MSLFAVALAVVAEPALSAHEARADEPARDVTATMQCERAPEVGRVKCSVEAHAKGGKTLPWGDVAIVELPELAAALKGRIGAESVVTRAPGDITWAFGLVARAAGRGEAKARVRLVVCEGAGRCMPVTLDVRASLDVG